MLTTIDNPFNPFTQYEDWLRFDEDKGYYTNNYLARIATVSYDMPDNMYEEEAESAIDEICDMNLTGLYIKVTPEDYKNNNWHPVNIKEIEKELES